MLNIDEVRLLGQLAADPQFGTTGTGGEWMRVRVLTNRPYRDKQGDWQEKVTGHSVVTFDKYRIEHGRAKLKKGDVVYVEGEHRESRREVDGRTEYSYGILVPMGGKLHQIVPAGALRRDDQGNQGSGRAVDGKNNQSPASKMREGGQVEGRDPSSDFDDEIPF